MDKWSVEDEGWSIAPALELQQWIDQYVNPTIDTLRENPDLPKDEIQDLIGIILAFYDDSQEIADSILNFYWQSGRYMFTSERLQRIWNEEFLEFARWLLNQDPSEYYIPHNLDLIIINMKNKYKPNLEVL